MFVKESVLVIQDTDWDLIDYENKENFVVDEKLRIPQNQSKSWPFHAQVTLCIIDIFKFFLQRSKACPLV